MTERLYLDDPYRRTFDAEVIAQADGWIALDRTLFHPGGGGQLPDRGTLAAIGAADHAAAAVLAVREDEDGRVWHQVGEPVPAIGARLQGTLDWPFRHALMRHHALMHIVNTIARDRFDGIITGVQLGADRSRIDFRLPAFGREQIVPFEQAVNDVIARDLAIDSAVITEAEFHRRPELIRTLNVLPPIVDGQVRIVEIATFDAQACGGTHVHSTGEIGQARLVKFDNKGKDNKRFYWELAASPDARGAVQP
jgi:misacylated tRNA(Ala) deacylase